MYSLGHSHTAASRASVFSAAVEGINIDDSLRSPRGSTAFCCCCFSLLWNLLSVFLMVPLFSMCGGGCVPGFLYRNVFHACACACVRILLRESEEFCGCSLTNNNSAADKRPARDAVFVDVHVPATSPLLHKEKTRKTPVVTSRDVLDRRASNICVLGYCRVRESVAQSSVAQWAIRRLDRGLQKCTTARSRRLRQTCAASAAVRLHHAKMCLSTPPLCTSLRASAPLTRAYTPHASFG